MPDTNQGIKIMAKKWYIYNEIWKKCILFAVLIVVSMGISAQTINQNQQNININFDNLPIIEKPVYITKYRTIYVDKPQPKRTAKRLEKPVLLLGYLWVYPYDLGEFTQNPTNVIKNINNQAPFNRSTWRIPTPDELAVMEANANKVGLGDGIYMATSHKNGILRLVSTGPTHTEIQAQKKAQLLKEEQERQDAELKRHKERNDEGVNINGTIWATRNMEGSPFSYGYNDPARITFASTPDDAGSWFVNPYDKKYSNGDKWTDRPPLPSGWQIPSVKDFEQLFQQGGVYDLENSCWRLGDIILPAAGYFQEKGYSGYISYDSDKGGRNCGYYLCSDGCFVFNLEKKTYASYKPGETGRYAWRESWKLRLIKKKNYNKYYD